MLNEWQALGDYLLTHDIARRVVYLTGPSGSGKTLFARYLQQQFPGRVIRLCLTHHRARHAQWIVTGDNALAHRCVGNRYAPEELWLQLKVDIQLSSSTDVLIVMENCHWRGSRIQTIVSLFHHHMPDARLLLLGEPQRRMQKRLAQHDVECLQIAGVSEASVRRLLVEGSGIACADEILTPPLVRRIARLCRGNCTKIARVGRAIALVQQASQTTLLTPRQWRLIWQYTDCKRGAWMRRCAIGVVSVGLLALGGMMHTFLPLHLPLPSFAMPVPVVAKQTAAVDIAQLAMNERDALSLLFGVWGYDVPPDVAWCESAARAGLLCKSGTATLSALSQQGLPWIASFNIGPKTLRAVVIHVGDETLDLLIGKQTWQVTRRWFESVWAGNYTLLWKTAPDGESKITPSSSEETLLWLDTMLNRALNITAEPDAQWRPVLVEKIKQFQQRHHLTADGLVGSSTLIQLWRAVGESAHLYDDEASLAINKEKERQ